MSKILLFYIIFPSKEVATKLSTVLINERLIACSNVFAIQSEYEWQEKFCHEDEFGCYMKTRIDNEKLVEAKVMELHPYDVPCIIRYVVKCNETYATWVHEQTELPNQPIR